MYESGFPVLRIGKKMVVPRGAAVFSMPVSWYSIPAQIKGVIDRLFSFVVGGKDIAGKRNPAGDFVWKTFCGILLDF